ncbi:MAG: DUF4423 domain-containing protein [Pseudobdellovibrionaceae bacterium]
MHSPFNYSNYREYLSNIMDERKQRGETKAELARIIGCQAAYLSQVMGEKVDLTEEHLLRLSEHLEFSEIETEYLLLLLRLSKAGTQNLKNFLEKQRVKMNKSAEELEPRLSSKKNAISEEGKAYYTSSWLPSVIHAATSCPHLKTVESMAKRLGLAERDISFHLERLEKYKLVQFNEGQWNYLGGSLHFSKNSPQDLQLQTARRLLALNHLSFKRESDIHYSVVYATDESTARELRKYLLDTIEHVHKSVEPTESKELYSLCIDVFKV